MHSPRLKLVVAVIALAVVANIGLAWLCASRATMPYGGRWTRVERNGPPTEHERRFWEQRRPTGVFGELWFVSTLSHRGRRKTFLAVREARRGEQLLWILEAGWPLPCLRASGWYVGAGVLPPANASRLTLDGDKIALSPDPVSPRQRIYLPLRPMPVPFIVNILCLVALPLSLLFGLNWWRQRRRRRRGLCPQCAYPMRESASVTCPECGATTNARP
jgi:hypothetical protein